MTASSEPAESSPMEVIASPGGATILAALSDNTRALIPEALRRHRRAGGGDALTLLVPPRTPPTERIRRDDILTDFLASGPWASGLRGWSDRAPPERCFRALRAALADRDPPVALDIVHRPEPEEEPPAPAGASADMILAHRGGDQYLGAAVASVIGRSFAGRTILCFDQEPDPAHCRALMQYEALELYEVSPNPAGPYVPRQHFALESSARYVAFQDTDDVSLPGRIEKLLGFAEARGADIVGCHELRFDEMTRTVEAIRLPLDANRGLDCGPAAVQLFSTTITRAECLRRLGGFSTVRTFGADRQFQLRAHWSARMLNVDSFLYVRRIREGSLTTAAETGMQSQVRKDANAAWIDAFSAYRDGRAGLAESALAVEPARTPFVIRNLRTGAVFPALLDLGGTGPAASRRRR